MPGPRYTSYPTAPEWVDSFGPDDFEQAIGESNAGGASAPLRFTFTSLFAKASASFSAAAMSSVINRNHEVLEPYLRNLYWEIDQVARRLDPSRPVVQFHWGGGTPTYLSPEQMEGLFQYTRETFRFAP